MSLTRASTDGTYMAKLTINSVCNVYLQSRNPLCMQHLPNVCIWDHLCKYMFAVSLIVFVPHYIPSYTLHYPCHMCIHVWRRCHMLVLIYLLTTYFMQALSSRKRQKVVDDVKQIVSADKNYRDQLRTINPPCVPFIGETPYIHAEIHHPCICIWVVCVAISFMHPPLCCRYVLKLDYVHPSWTREHHPWKTRPLHQLWKKVWHCIYLLSTTGPYSVHRIAKWVWFSKCERGSSTIKVLQVPTT